MGDGAVKRLTGRERAPIYFLQDVFILHVRVGFLGGGVVVLLWF